MKIIVSGNTKYIQEIFDQADCCDYNNNNKVNSLNDLPWCRSSNVW